MKRNLANLIEDLLKGLFSFLLASMNFVFSFVFFLNSVCCFLFFVFFDFFVLVVLLRFLCHILCSTFLGGLVYIVF
ncbi:hypothetical protein KSS87_022729 [Heliosperma pusillum]|nr:hypothetical protein KSS87_022729 [Heliosperma pusillum]